MKQTQATERTCSCHHLLCSQSKESIGFIQDQVVEPGEEEAAAGEQTRQNEWCSHQQQACKSESGCGQHSWTVALGKIV